MPPTDGKFKLRFILDRTTLEIYAQDGLYYASNIFFMADKDGNPDLPARLTYSATDSVNATSVDVQALNSIYNLPICDEIQLQTYNIILNRNKFVKNIEFLINVDTLNKQNLNILYG